MKAKATLASRYLRAEVLLYGSLALGTVFLAFDQLRATVRFSDLLYLNSTLTAADVNNPKVTGSLVERAEKVIAANECRSDIVRAGVWFVMKDLELQDSALRYDEWAKAMDRADRYVRHGLSCNPADGDMWARLALVSQAIAENPQQLSELMSQSVLLSPSEANTLRARFVLWKKASALTLSLSSRSLDQDLRTLLSYANPSDIRDALGTQNPDMKTYNLVTANAALNTYIVAASKLLLPQRQLYLDSRGIKLPLPPAP